MPREARKKSESNIYHVMLRGINRQIIFEDDGDRHYFMTVLKHCKDIAGFRLYAFCLMSNHVHLLIEPAGEPLSQIFKRVGSKYVYWYNQKYQRVGHLFQDRYRSENVETNHYFMTVLRYILQNPMKAQYAMDLFGSRDTLLSFVQQANDDTAMDEIICDRRLREALAKETMERITHCSSASDFQQLDNQLKKEYVKQMYLENLSSVQISRLTGMPKTTILRTIRGLSPHSSAPLALREEWTGRDGSLWTTW